MQSFCGIQHGLLLAISGLSSCISLYSVLMTWINKLNFCPTLWRCILYKPHWNCFPPWIILQSTSACCKVVPAAKGLFWLLAQDGKLSLQLRYINRRFIYRISNPLSCWGIAGWWGGGIKIWKLASPPCSTKMLLANFSRIVFLITNEKARCTL